MGTSIERIGVVEGVEAKRRNKEVVYLQVTVRFQTKLKEAYGYSNDDKVDVISLSYPVDADVNPGDMVAFTIGTQQVVGKRFAPALEASNVDSVTYARTKNVPAVWSSFATSTETYVSDTEDKANSQCVVHDDDDGTAGVMCWEAPCGMWATVTDGTQRGSWCRVHDPDRIDESARLEVVIDLEQGDE